MSKNTRVSRACIVLGLATIVACSTKDDGPSNNPSTGGAGGGGGAGGSAGAGATGGTVAVPDDVWTWVDVPGSSCRDGTPTGFAFNSLASSKDLLIYLKGGAACSDPYTCAIGNKAFGEAQMKDYVADPHPLLDRGQPDNPLKAYDQVLIPECTGDVYWGSNPSGQVDKVDGTQHFVGFINYGLFLQRIATMFSGAKRVVMAGCSAGGFGVRANLERTVAAFPGVPFTVISDSALPVGDPYCPSSLQAAQRDLWQLQESILGPCGADCPDKSDFGFDAASAVFKRNPGVRFGIISYAPDTALPNFWGLTPQKFNEGLWASRDKMINAHPNVAYYVIDGEGHCIPKDAFSSTTVAGTKLTDWVASLTEGTVQQVGQPPAGDAGADSGADAGP